MPYYSHGEPRDRSCLPPPPPAVSYRRVTRPAIRVLALAVFAGLFLGLSPGFAQTPDCSNGVAVRDPTNNPGLAADCETLLAARDTLAGTATLNWSDSTSIDSWTGLTIDLTWTKAGGADSDAFTLNKSGDLASVSAKDKNYEELFHSFASGTQTSNTFDGTELDVDGTRFAQGATRTVETDRAALVALYNSTNGTSWLNSTNWNTTAELSTWFGVRTDADGLVRYLGLKYNQLSGSIPAELGDLTNLTYLDLSGNLLSGPIPAKLGDLTNLTYLGLQANQLSGSIPAELGNLTNLETLNMARNQLSGPIPAELGDLTNLRLLGLAENQLSGPIPAELDGLTNLTNLGLDHNQLSGSIPAELGNLTNLETLILTENQLNGPIPAELDGLTNLTHLSLNDNQLSGSIPTELGNLTNLETLNMARNQLSGPIPTKLGDLTNLTDLSLSGNQLSGPIPTELGKLINLGQLDLSGNLLSRSIPTELGKLINLFYLYLNDNQLTGSIPTELGGITYLGRLQLHDNQLTGPIPAELGGLTDLTYLSLNDNQLSGPIPEQLGGLTNLADLSLSGNQLTGSIPTELGDLTNLGRLQLHDNQLTGSIPAELGGITYLEQLDLSGNQLSGSIPAELGGLTYLEQLGLKDNRLTGSIPAELGDLTYLQNVRFALNSLTGCVPLGLRHLLGVSNDYDSTPAHDFIEVDANNDGDTNDDGDVPGLDLPFCMLRTLTLSNGTLTPKFATGTTTYTASVGNNMETTVTATTHNTDDSVSITKDEDTYTSGESVPLDVGPNVITIEVTSSDATPKQTITVEVTRATAPNTSPEFPTSETGRTVPENTPAGRPVGAPVAADDPENDTLTYTLGGTDASSFDIVTSTGQLQTKTALDHETKPNYSVTVSVHDSKDLDGNPDVTADGMIDVTVTVTDVDEPAVISGSASPDYAENRTGRVARYTATDPEGGDITWSLTGTDAGDFEISASGVLSFREIPNHELPADSNRDNVYEVTVRARDGTSYGTLAVTVTVTNINEAAVVSGDPSPDYAENRTGRVARYTASDPEGETVTWSLAGTDAGDFAVAGGVLSFRLSPNYESPADSNRDNVYEVTVRARDVTSYGTLAVTVTVTNINEAAVISGDASPDYAENRTDRVARYTATDPEGGDITWSLTGTDAGDFEISASGVLSFREIPNHELPADSNRDNVYEVTVRARDGTSYGTLAVTVTVTNINEAAVVSGDPSPDYAENRTDRVARYTASDPEGETVTWSLAGTDAGDFAVAGGVLSFRLSPNYESPADSNRDNVYEVTVRARDVTSYGTLDVTVTVTNINEAAVITGDASPDYAENRTDQVARYTATDPEGGDITWSLTGTDAGDFEISASGVLSFREIPNHELPADSGEDNVYLVTVRALDGSLDVVVTVTDVNEAPIVSGRDDVDYVENGAGPVGVYSASDPEGSPVTLSLAGTDAGDLELSDSGVLRFRRSPDYESPDDSGRGDNVYSVVVEAGDGVNTSMRPVTVTVINEDEPGVVRLSSAQPQVGTGLGADLSDPDGSVIAVTWVWERRQGSGGWATIGGATEDAYTPVDADLNHYLRVTASYTDGEGSGKAAEAVSTNAVQEAPSAPNTAPSFPSSETGRREVEENTPAGREFGDPVEATDDNAEDTLTYKLEGVNAAAFDIDELSGQLRTEAPLDYDEGKRSYSMMLVVTDSSGEFDRIGVRVDVTNIDEPPDLSGPTAVDYDENSRGAVASYTADDPEGATIVWTLEGADQDDFAISRGGVLTFSSPPDYEAPTGSGGNNIYVVIVEASDGTYTLPPAGQ